MAVRRFIRQQIRRILLRRLLVDAVGGAAVQDAGAEEACEAGGYVGRACAEGGLPGVRCAGCAQIHIGMCDLAWLVERKVEAVWAVSGVGGEDCGVGWGGCGEVVRRVGFVGVGFAGAVGD
jgi:hypothetical protein